MFINLPLGEVLTTGTYHLIQYSGTIGGSGSAAFELGTYFYNNRLISHNLVEESGYIDLSYATDTVTWTGSTSTQWSTLSRGGELHNHQRPPTHVFRSPSTFVIFDNSAGSNTVVNMNFANVTPFTVTFNNDPSHPYTLESTSGLQYGIHDNGSPTPPTTLTKTGAGTLTITTPNNSYTGGTFLEQGTIVVGVSNALPPAGSLTMGSTGTSGTLDLAGNSQQVSGLSVAAGAVAAAQVIASSGTASNATLIYNGTGPSSFGGTIQNAIGGGNQQTALTVTSGLLNLSGNNTYSGPTTISAGTLQVGNLAALGNGGVVANGGVLDLNANSIGVPSLSGGTGTITDMVPTTGFPTVLTVNQAGTTAFGGRLADGPNNQVALSMSGNGMLTLSGSSSYSGGTTVGSGTLQAGSNTAFGSANGPLAVNGGVLDIGGNTVSVGNLSGAGGTILNNGGNVAVLAIGSGSYGGIIANGAGTLALSKDTTGTLTLWGANTFSGGVTVGNGTANTSSNGTASANSGGYLVIGNSSAFGTGTITALGGQMQAAAPGITVSNPVNVSTSGFRFSGSNPLTFTGQITLVSKDRSICNYFGHRGRHDPDHERGEQRRIPARVRGERRYCGGLHDSGQWAHHRFRPATHGQRLRQRHGRPFRFEQLWRPHDRQRRHADHRGHSRRRVRHIRLSRRLDRQRLRRRGRHRRQLHEVRERLSDYPKWRRGEYRFAVESRFATESRFAESQRQRDLGRLRWNTSWR